MSRVKKTWVAVASAEHVRAGKGSGIMQVCHGKAAPLRRIVPGDGIIYYSPSSSFGRRDHLQAFTAIGTVAEGEPYQVEMAPGFTPWRRNVRWETAREVPIRPLLGELVFTGGTNNWGYRFRFGLFEIGEADAALIAAQMLGAPK